ncbi:MAG: hypothetical protein PUB98_09865 [Clostridiales bacterium]|nr:hypothetical protein [Clostridiales bacterium]
MEKFCRKGHPGRYGNRWLALLMSLSLMGTMLPISVRAENGSTGSGLCEHHTEHTAECGYVEVSEGSPYTFVCDIWENEAGAEGTNYASAPAVITISAASGSASVTPDTPVAPVNEKGLGVSIIADPTAPKNDMDAWKGSYLYFGTYNSNPVKYRVLDRTTTDFGGTTMLLDSDSILWAGTSTNGDNQRADLIISRTFGQVVKYRLI